MKRIVSLLLSFVLISASLLACCEQAFAEDGGYYLFAYFTGNARDEQQVRFAVSDNGLDFKALNSNRPVITQTKGTKCSRDPYIFKGKDNYYYIIATDMDASTGNWWDNSNTFVLWRSKDLINWGDEFIFNMYDMYERLGLTGTIHCTWAPQVIWDGDAEKYMVYFALADDGISNSGSQQMYYMYTSDLMDFSKYETPQLLYKAPTQSAIDGDIVYNESEGLYYLYYKDESNATICYVTSDRLNGGYSSEPVKVFSGETALEGCNCHFVNGKLTMLADAYTSNYFVAMQSDDYKSFNLLPFESYSVNHLSPRHGSVTEITESQYKALSDKFGVSDYTDIQYKLTDKYSAETSWDWHTYKDASAHYFDIATTTKTEIGNGRASLDNSNIFIGENAVHSLICKNNYTLSFKFSINRIKTAKIFAIASDSYDYIALFDNGDFLINGTKIDKLSFNAYTDYALHLTYDGNTVKLYIDGVKKCETQADIDFPALGNAGYIGLGYSDLNTPRRISAVYSSIRFRDKALSEKEVSDEYNYKEPAPTPVKPPTPSPAPKITVKTATIKKAAGGKKSFTVYFKKLSGITGYQLQYSANKSFKKSKTVNLKKSLTKKTVKKLKGKKKYYIRLRAYRKYNGKTYVGKWSKTKTVKTK